MARAQTSRAATQRRRRPAATKAPGKAEIWMVSAEAAPLAHVGGMGDVLRALPSALSRLGLSVRRFLPAYGNLDRRGFRRMGLALSIPLGPREVPVRFLSRTEPDGVRTTLVECNELFGRDWVYGPPGSDDPDNARRFTLLCRAVCERARRAKAPPAILHVHDWHAALLPLFVRFTDPWQPRRPRSVLSIHNFGYQGRFSADEIRWLSLGPVLRDHMLHPDRIEFYGSINFLKAGLRYADRITAVSPTYAREIQTPEGGFGLDGVVGQRSSDVVGILNGADYEVWNAAADPHLPLPYTADTLDAKQEAAGALRRRIGLPETGGPLLGLVGRLVHQKGIDILARAAPALLECGADLALLGAGEPAIEDDLKALRNAHPERIGLYLGYDEALSHLIVAGSDLMLVPSRYEPCGLVQMHALRYGTPPVVHETGGLADTVRDEPSAPGEGTGFVFGEPTAEALAGAVRRALALRQTEPERWRDLQRRAMGGDFTWDRAARQYAALYRDLLR